MGISCGGPGGPPDSETTLLWLDWSHTAGPHEKPTQDTPAKVAYISPTRHPTLLDELVCQQPLS